MNLKCTLPMFLALLVSSFAANADILDDLFSKTTDSQRKQSIIDARNGKYDEAVNRIRNVLADTKNAPDVLCDYAVILKWAGRYEEALKAYSEIPKDYRIPDSVQTEMAIAYYKLGKFTESAALFEKYLPKNEKDEKPVEMMVEACVRSGNSDKALKYLDDRTKGSKEIPDWLKRLAVRARHGKAVEAARAGKLQESLASLKSLITETDDRKSIYYDYIVILSWDRQYEEALKAFKEISSKQDLPSYLLEAVFNCYEQTGGQAGKLEIARKLVLAPPLESKKLELMFLCCEKTDSPETGIETAETLMKGNPDKKDLINHFLVKLRHMLATKLARNGEHEKSLAILDGLLKETGNETSIMADYILVLSWAGKKDDARRLYDEYFKDRKAPEYLMAEITGIPADKKTAAEEKPKEAVEAVKTGPVLEKPVAAPAETDSTIEKYITSGKLNEAIDEIGRKLSKVDGEKDALNKSLSKIHEKAVQEARDGRYDEAFAVLDKLLEIKYESPSVLSDKIIITVWCGKYEEAIGMYKRFRSSYTPKNFLLDAVGTAYRRTGKYAEAIACYNESLSLNPDNPEAARGKVFSMIEAGQAAEAHIFIENETSKIKDAPKWLKMLPCEAFIVEGRYDKADIFLREYLKTNPGDMDARKMLVEVLIQNRSGLQEASSTADELMAANPGNSDISFLKVTILQLQRNYLSAYDLNEKILARNKYYRPSINARYHILLDMKAATLADQMLKETGDDVSYAVKKRIMGDLAAEQLAWKDYKKALQTIDENIRMYDEYKNIPEASADADMLKIRARFDRILALFQAEKMQELTKEYESLKEDGVDTPSWLRLNVASAYLYCRKPDTALAMYREIREELKKSGNDAYPDNYLALQGIYSCLIEIEDQKAAYEILEVLEKETPAFARPNGIYVENTDKMDLMVERGWWYIYNDQLSYADEYLSGLLEKANYNTNIRTALAYVHYYRGWPRLALQDFQISTALDPNDRSAQIGLAYTLNENDEWEKARTIAAELARMYPADLAVKQLQRSLELQEKRTLTIDSNYSNEGNFSDGSGVTIRLDQPIYPDRKIYTETLWLYTSQPKDSNQEAKHRNIFRGAVGFDWRLDRDLTIFGEASMDYHAENPGFMAGLRYSPSDHLTLTGFYNSYTLNMPPKALLFGYKGQEANVSAEYRFSEDLILSGGFSNVWVSDGNINQTYSWKIDKGIYSTAYWKFRAAVQGSTTTNTEYQDSEYYAPRYYTSIYFVPMVEHLWYRRYETSITDRLYLGLGPHWEKDYTCKSQYYLQYEQEYILTDYFGFKVGGKIGKERYGDDNPCGWGLYANVTYKF
ncbi:MAG TPA: hypothetical protein DET40_25330 [Lentisphaeria bacterium]|nr:MAG: hypothetical protein A2X45_18635 [Lentisphaerae bacterium GWF2_50_93]HCE46884.1 hypothetical protein [Lentisphaeria bacterium]